MCVPDEGTDSGQGQPRDNGFGKASQLENNTKTPQVGSASEGLQVPGQHEGAARPRRCRVFNPYTEFPEFSRRLIKDLECMFRRYDAGRDGYIDLMELKLMMEKLGAPQTHLGLKAMIKEVDEDLDDKLSFREFLLIFHKAAAGDLQEDSGLMALAERSEIDVALEGVKGAKDFFEAKVQALSSASKFEAELKAEQEERKQEEEERRLRRAAFRELKAAFST
ncbi:EF-hand domain-containing protein D1 [Orycteropus afer afer]|uniref:EF-hand domain-containing protein D1 n=1 Tax=Orycteropus afer afer TaxID=1230840 RepID=A0A8B7A3L3_ORYAF|nr:EF-hand domain-containing protein D1 [Orycteropus afer afer]